jgi:hypothetical protein
MPHRTRLVAVNRQRWLTRALAVLAIVAGGAAGSGVAYACSCDANPPCRAFWSADVVFLGTVASVGVEPPDARVDRPVAILDVDEALRGAVNGRVRVIVPAEPRSTGPALAPGTARSVLTSSCDYDFQVGQRYLVYAHRRQDGTLVTTDCAGTKPADRAFEDLAFIQSVPGLPPGGRIFGTATRVFANLLDSARSRAEPATGLRLLFEREQQQFEVATGADGEYELTVPPGEYTLRPDVPETIRAYYPRVVRVADRGCAPCSVSITANGRIEGTLTSPDGRPLAKQSVLALPADAVTGEELRASSLQVGQTRLGATPSTRCRPVGTWSVSTSDSAPASDRRTERTTRQRRSGRRRP